MSGVIDLDSRRKRPVNTFVDLTDDDPAHWLCQLFEAGKSVPGHTGVWFGIDGMDGVKINADQCERFSEVLGELAKYLNAEKDEPARDPKQPRHVDEFIDDMDTDNYAAFVLDHFRQSAVRRMRFDAFMPHKLFCLYEGKRYRVTGASRLGDVWLSADFKRETGYELRVDVDSCSEWGAKP